MATMGFIKSEQIDTTKKQTSIIITQLRKLLQIQLHLVKRDLERHLVLSIQICLSV